MVLLERLTKEDWTQASWGESDPPFVGRKQPEQSQINPKKRKPHMFAKMMVKKDWTVWNQQHRDSASKAAWSASDAANTARSDNAAMMKLHRQAQQAHESAAQGYAKESNQYKEHMSEASTHARRSNEFRDKSANDKGFSTGASQAVRRSGFSNSSF